MNTVYLICLGQRDRIQSYYLLKCYRVLILLLEAERLHNFTVAVGSILDPTSFNPETYTPCAYEAGQLLLGETRQMMCDKPIIGRYITVYTYQTETAKPPLTICELQVFGGPVPGKLLCSFVLDFISN